MEKDFILYILILLLPLSISGQCPVGDIQINSQTDIDHFNKMYPNCKVINGNLEINTHGCLIPISDISCFNKLEEIKGNLEISFNSELKTLNGFKKLFTIGGAFEVFKNDKLESLTGLNNLSSVGALTIHFNKNIKTIRLNKLSRIGKKLYFDSDSALEDIRIPNLTDVKSIVLKNNPRLSNISKITGVALLKELYIQTNNLLTSMDWLPALRQIEELLYIDDCDYLKNVDFLSNIIKIKSLSVRNCKNIKTLRLPVKAVNLESFSISGNDSLKILSGYNEVGPEINLIQISNNKLLEEIEVLNSVEIVTDDVIVSENLALFSLKCFHKLRNVKNDVRITGNKKLKTYDGLNSLEIIGRHLHIAYNTEVKNIRHFTALRSIGGTLSIEGHDGLDSLNGFDNLRSVEGSVRITNNENIVSCGDFPALEEIKKDLYFWRNDKLSLIKSSKLVKIGGDFTISYPKILSTQIQMNSLKEISGHFHFTNSKVGAIDLFKGLIKLDGKPVPGRN